MADGRFATNRARKTAPISSTRMVVATVMPRKTPWARRMGIQIAMLSPPSPTVTRNVVVAPRRWGANSLRCRQPCQARASGATARMPIHLSEMKFKALPTAAEPMMRTRTPMTWAYETRRNRLGSVRTNWAAKAKKLSIMVPKKAPTPIAIATITSCMGSPYPARPERTIFLGGTVGAE